jgi:hypothetical protein
MARVRTAGCSPARAVHALARPAPVDHRRRPRSAPCGAGHARDAVAPATGVLPLPSQRGAELALLVAWLYRAEKSAFNRRVTQVRPECARGGAV